MVCGSQPPLERWPIDDLAHLPGRQPCFQHSSAKSIADQAGITYRKTVLLAFQDVENALIAFGKEWEHRKVLNDAVTYNRRAVDLSTQLYTQGTTDFLSVLDAERSLFTSQTALAAKQGSHLRRTSSPFTKRWAAQEEKGTGTGAHGRIWRHASPAGSALRGQGWP